MQRVMIYGYYHTYNDVQYRRLLEKIFADDSCVSNIVDTIKNRKTLCVETHNYCLVYDYLKSISIDCKLIENQIFIYGRMPPVYIIGLTQYIKEKLLIGLGEARKLSHTI